jgi:hypothetical protein
MSTQTNSLDQLVHDLLEHSLIMNEYKQQNKMIETDKYIKLMDGYLELAKEYRKQVEGMQEIFSEVDKLGGRK